MHVCVAGGGGNIFYILSLHKKLSTDLSGFHHPSLIQGCSKSETRRKSGRLAGTWRVLKGDGGVGASRRGWGWSAQPGVGEAPFHGFRHLGRVFIFMLSGYPNYSPLPPFSRGLGTDVPHCRNAARLRKKLESF